MNKKERKPDGYWTLEQTTNWIEQLTMELGRYPTYKEIGRSALYPLRPNLSANYTKIRENMPSNITINITQKYSDRVKSKCYTEEETVKIIKKIFGEHMPMYDELKNNIKLRYAIEIYGGHKKFASKHNFVMPNCFKTTKGTIVSSTYEAKIANYLELNDIVYKHDGKILEGYERKFRYDFMIKNKYGEYIYIEMWGRENSEYIKNKEIKKELYKNNNYHLISVEPSLMSQSDNIIFNYLSKQMIKFDVKTDNFHNDPDDISKYIAFNTKILIDELKNYCIKHELKIFPTYDEWIELGFSKHINYINTNNISVHNIASEIGLCTKTLKHGYYNDEENIKKELQKIIDDLGKFPTYDEMYVVSSTLATIVSRDMESWAKKMGLKTTKQLNGVKPADYWSEKRIKQLLTTIIKNNDNNIPNRKHFESLGKRNLYNAILSKYESVAKCAIKLIIKCNIKKNHENKNKGFWQGEQGILNILKELTDIINRSGNFPTCTYLFKNNRYLDSAIRLHDGGYEFFAKKLGYKKVSKDWIKI
jgi:hypothetical protein